MFFSAIELKEARHSVFLLFPLALLAGLTIRELLPDRVHLVSAAVLLVAGATLAQTLLFRPVHYVDGYRQVVDFVAGLAPANSNIVFSGYRDGAFIFVMRAHGDRDDINVIRADKLLLRISVRRELGVEQRDYDNAEIADLIDSMAVHYVVAQPGFWTDLDQMARLQDVLQGPRFEEVARFPMTANYPAQESELLVYRNLGAVAEGPVAIDIELPIIGRDISSTPGN